MKGFIALKSFWHDKQYAIGDKVELPEDVCKDLENRDVIKWAERPVIIMPKESFKEFKKTIPITKEGVEVVKPKRKKRVRKSKK